MPAIHSRALAFVVLAGAPAVRGDAILQLQSKLMAEADATHSAAFNTSTYELWTQLILADERCHAAGRGGPEGAQGFNIPAGCAGRYAKIETTIDPRVLELIGVWTQRHAGLPAEAP